MTRTATNKTFFGLLRRIIAHLSRQRKLQLLSLFVLMICSAFAEAVTLGAVLPFIGALTAPEQLFKSAYVGQIAADIGIIEPDQLVLPMTALFASAAIVAAIIRVLLVRANTRLAFSTGADLGVEIYKRTLYQPYQTHVTRNSSEVISGVTRKVDGVVTGILMPLLVLASSAILFAAILAVLLSIDWKVALIASAIFGVSYGTTTLIYRRSLNRNGQRIAQEQAKLFQALQEGLAGIRDVLLNGSQEYYSATYRKADIPLRRAQGNISFVGQFPRYVMEALGMVLIAVLAFFLTTQGGNTSAPLPVLAALALGGQRMLPALQQGYAAWSTIIGSMATLQDTVVLLEQPLPHHAKGILPRALTFSSTIQLRAVSFQYEQSDAPILHDINLAIPKGARVGVIGETGAGKSTLVDILLGLLTPSTGKLLIDGAEIAAENASSWQQNIAHVPQSIFLTDGSFAQNIALGTTQDTIDLDTVKRAAEQAQIADFIGKQPLGYDHAIGENGVRLSGGQRQRIGIARALYRNANVLFFDEATSALDSATEQSVMTAIANLQPDLTIIMIAHRLSTLANCTQIIELDAGQITRQGTFSEIVGDGNLLGNSLSPFFQICKENAFDK